MGSHDENSTTTNKMEDSTLSADESEILPNKEAFINKVEQPTGLRPLNVISIIIAVLSILIIAIIALDECRTCLSNKHKYKDVPKNLPKKLQKTFWVHGKNIHSGYLSNVFDVLEVLGFSNETENSDWDLLWAHDYPFKVLYSNLSNLKPHQKVNHFPGCGYITNKVDLATSNLKYIPPAFKLPNDKEKLLEYSRKNPELTFVQKKNDHRNIKIEKIAQIDLDKEGTFIQEYIDKPLLVSGHKFDIGIYTIMTSIDPLRVYIYNGDALLRFCPEKYYPFNATNLDKYVVGDDYIPTWEIPALETYYNELGFGMKDSLSAYLKSQGKKPNLIWDQIEDAIRIVTLDKESLILGSTIRFKSTRNFFEMMRFDFVVDENLKVYLLEANMSPNLSSAHFAPNKLLYYQVIYNMMSLVGVGERFSKATLTSSKKIENMLVTSKNIAVYAKQCASKKCQASCEPPICQLCQPCLSSESLQTLNDAFKEHLNIGDCKRIVPPTMEANANENTLGSENLSPENRLHYLWYQGKCNLDKSFC